MTVGAEVNLGLEDIEDHLHYPCMIQRELMRRLAARTYFPRLNDFIHTHITCLYTFGCCISSKAGEVNKSGICATARTITTQWLVRLIDSPVKAQVTHRCRVIDGCHH